DRSRRLSDALSDVLIPGSGIRGSRLAIEQVFRAQRPPPRLAGGPHRDDLCRICSGANTREPLFGAKQSIGGFELELWPVQLVQHARDLDADANRVDGGAI